MAFCSNCGAQLIDGNKFCSNCGAVVGGVAAVAAPIPMQQTYAPVMQQPSAFDQASRARMESLTEIGNLINFFSQKQPQYDEYDLCNRRIPFLQKGVGKQRIVWGIILCSIGGLLGLNIVSNLSAGKTSNYTILAVTLIAFLSLCFIIPGVILLITRSVAVKKNRNELERALTREAQLADELTVHYNNYGSCIVGAEYTNPKILMKIADIIRSGRAYTINEAINILFNDARRSMKQLQSALTLQASRQAARGATSAAVFSAASFFIR